MLAEFFAWWGQNLLDLVPAALRNRAGAGADALVVDATEPGVITLRRRRNGVESKLATVRLDDTAPAAFLKALPNRRPDELISLRVAPALVLEREVSLPLAAERDYERVVGYDMERLTPFAADEVFWGVQLTARDKARGKIALVLSIVPRAAIADVVRRLTAAGLPPAMLETAPASGAPGGAPGGAPWGALGGAPGGGRSIRLSHDGRRSGGMLARAVPVFAAGLVLFVVISPFLRQALVLSRLESREGALKPQIAEVEALRARILGTGTGGDAVAAEMRRTGDALAALAAITEILPDESYLSEFTLRERKLNLTGLSTSAAKLIAALSDDPRVRNPAFSAPVTRNDTVRLDVFSIRAELAQ